jgi:hypothetical protein
VGWGRAGGCHISEVEDVTQRDEMTRPCSLRQCGTAGQGDKKRGKRNIQHSACPWLGWARTELSYDTCASSASQGGSGKRVRAEFQKGKTTWWTWPCAAAAAAPDGQTGTQGNATSRRWRDARVRALWATTRRAS